MTLRSYFLKISSGNRLQALKFELKRLLTAGNRLPILCDQQHNLKFEFKYLVAVVNYFWSLVIDYILW